MGVVRRPHQPPNTMRITQLQPAALDVLALMGGADKSPRSVGVHLSTIISSLATAIKIKRVAAGWDLDVAAQIGFLWEQVFEHSMAQLFGECTYIRVGEQAAYVDGCPVYGTPDLLYVPDFRLTELKCRWRTVRTWDDLAAEYPEVLWQTKAYCHMLGTTSARLIMLFIVGDWKGSGPLVRGCDLEFDQRELDDNWSMLMRHARSQGLFNGTK